MARKELWIIARRVPVTFATVKQRFSGQPDIEVILDRRHVQRRRAVLPTEADRRVRERRALNVEGVLRQLGWAIVERRVDET
ncbi:MAG TPA: hypothetical protein VIF11_22005 [Methylomirabilota bacterium]|jgi:hypothetical protein